MDGVISSIKATSNNITSAHKFSDLASSALKDVSSLKKDDYLKIGIVGSELLAVGEDLGKAYLQMMTKDISRNEFVRVSIERVSCAAGATLGAILIPVNFAIGQTLGSLIGRGVGKLIGRTIVKNAMP